MKNIHHVCSVKLHSHSSPGPLSEDLFQNPSYKKSLICFLALEKEMLAQNISWWAKTE